MRRAAGPACRLVVVSPDRQELLKWEDKAWEAETNWWNEVGKAIHDGGDG